MTLRFSIGTVVGCWTLVRRIGYANWVARCSCGRRESRINPYSPTSCCRTCYCERVGVVRATKKRVCERCGEDDPERLGEKVSECDRCERRRLRNGLCPQCQAALHGGLRGFCARCGWSRDLTPPPRVVRRPPSVRRRVTAVVEALYGACVLPTPALAAEILEVDQEALVDCADLFPAEGRRARVAALAKRWMRGESIHLLAAQVGLSHNTLRGYFGEIGKRKNKKH